MATRAAVRQRYQHQHVESLSHSHQIVRRVLVQSEKAPDNPFAHMKDLETEADIRRERRAITADQFARLIAATMHSDVTFRGLACHDRAMAYITACYSGLRARELATLTAASIDLDGDPPVLTVQARYSKRRRKDVQPIRRDLAAMLKN